MIRLCALVCLSAFVAVGAAAQIGGNGLSKPSSNTLGFTQFVQPPPSTTKLNSGPCRGWPTPSFGQPTNLIGGYAVILDSAGHPHYVSGC